ncbi:hypothetical protein DL96DRAFT_1623698 [Flagelloscypha sp. PMI_526]|nr:hypothetical protein DL96DRAFT_1623698 [Flagelloscypha sp. PMI_526]
MWFLAMRSKRKNFQSPKRTTRSRHCILAGFCESHTLSLGKISQIRTVVSRFPLWTSAGYNTPPKKRTIPQRRCLALRYLFEYSRAYVAKYGCPQGPQYVWIDELCISPLDISGFGSMHIGRSPSLWSQNQGDDMKEERQEELGRLTDIFRTAKCVCVFCERFGCDHTDVNCKWGQRAWTLSEIVHASTVLQMTASHFNSGRWSWDLRKIEGRLFKGHMKGHAERNQKWHLHAVLEHATNSGSTSWQHTIQALVIEVIRRSDVSGYGYGGRHTYSEIGRALNGLLPRRANPKCFSKNNGWADLTMLLELNQGFYNTAALAAVCPVAHHTEHLHRWLAKPIDPKPGQERIEPLVKAFPIIDPSPPVRSISDFRGRPQLDEASGRQGLNTALCLVDPHVIELKPVFKRDGSTIYSTPMNPLRICVLATLGLVFILGIVVIPTNRNAGVAVCWLTTCIYAFIRLALGTMCVKMDGWVCWEEQDGEMEHLDRVHFDSNLSQFRTWDTLHHLAPEFPLPETTPTRTVTIMDLKNMIQIPVKIPANAKKPSYIVPIALHGSGITCILVVDQEGNVRDSENPKEYVWTKVGMVHLPTFILEDARVVGTFYVGGRPPLGIQGSHSTC